MPLTSGSAGDRRMPADLELDVIVTLVKEWLEDAGAEIDDSRRAMIRQHLDHWRAVWPRYAPGTDPYRAGDPPARHGRAPLD